MKVTRQTTRRKHSGESQLLDSYLERVSWRILQDYSTHLKSLIRSRRGIYALYHHERLYYVGLASNLMWRVKAHLRDGHRRKWDRFSVYVTANDSHTRQLESLVLRILQPGGNKVRGGLKGATNLLTVLDGQISEADADRRARLLGGYVVKRRLRAKTFRSKGSLTLANLVDRRVSLRGRFRGVTYRATLLRDGHIRYKGQLFKAPSTAAHAIVKRNVNGWQFWKYRNEKRRWVPLREINR